MYNFCLVMFLTPIPPEYHKLPDAKLAYKYSEMAQKEADKFTNMMKFAPANLEWKQIRDEYTRLCSFWWEAGMMRENPAKPINVENALMFLWESRRNLIRLAENRENLLRLLGHIE